MNFRFYSVMSILLFVALIVSSCTIQSTQSNNSGKPVVAATIFPIYDILSNVGDGVIEPVLILDPGQSPHTFDPTPQELRKINQAIAIIQIGHQLDDWVLNITKSPNIRVISVDQNIDLKPSLDFHHNNHHSPEESIDPHYWLDPENAVIITHNIQNLLTELVPQKSDLIEANSIAYQQALHQLISSKNSIASHLTQKNIITFHGGWQYFADSLGMEVLAVFEPFPGQSPTPEYVRLFQTKIKASKVKFIYTEPQLNTPALQTLAKDANIAVKVLDPIGGIQGRDSYIKLMEYNFNQISSQ